MSKAIGDATPTTNRKSGGVNQPATIKKERQPCQSSSDNQRADRPRWLSVNRTFWLTLSNPIRTELARYQIKHARVLGEDNGLFAFLCNRLHPLNHRALLAGQAQYTRDALHPELRIVGG